MANIQIDYENVLRKVSELETLRDQLVQIESTDVADAMTIVSASWHGSAAEEMMGKLKMYDSKLLSCISELNGAISYLRNSATTWYNTEKAIQDAMQAIKNPGQTIKNILHI